MTKQEIISKYERKTEKKAYIVLGDRYIYQLKNGSFCIKEHPFLYLWNREEVYCIGEYAVAFFNGKVDIKRIDLKENKHNVYYGEYDKLGRQ